MAWSTQQVSLVRERVSVLPEPINGWLRSVWKALFGRFSTLLAGLRTLAVGGVAPMILFCLAFLLSHYAEVATAEVIRWVVGPRDTDQMVALNTYVRIAGTSVSMLVQVSLVAAAVDRLLITARRQEAAQTDRSVAPTTP